MILLKILLLDLKINNKELVEIERILGYVFIT